MVKKHGLSNSYQLAPRAQIFRRDIGNVQDTQSLQYLMRYNDYLNDPIAYASHPTDLASPHPTPRTGRAIRGLPSAYAGFCVSLRCITFPQSRGDLTSANYTTYVRVPNRHPPRARLMMSRGQAAGCYDAKYTTYALAMQMQSIAIDGPTNQVAQPAHLPSTLTHRAIGPAFVHVERVPECECVAPWPARGV